MGLIERASAAWGVLRGGERLDRVGRHGQGTVTRADLLDLPIRRAPVSRVTSFQFLPSISTRKGTRPGTWDLLEAYNEIPALRTCVDLLAPAAARIAYEVYRVRKPAERRQFERLQRAIGADKEHLRRAMVDAGDLEPVPDHPVALFLRRGVDAPVLGFPVLTSFDARVLLYKYALLCGEGFEIIERKGPGRGRSQRGEPSGRVTICPSDVRGLPTMREPYYIVVDADGIEHPIPAEDMLYRREVNPRDPYGRGTGASHALGTEIEIDRLQSSAMADSWGSGGVPPVLVVGDFGGVSGTPGSPPGPFGATEDETAARAKRMLHGWERAVDRGKPYFMDGVDADGKPNVTVHDLSRTMQQMEAQASRSATWSNIAQVIGRIPPEIRGVTQGSNRATATAAWYLLQTGYLLSEAERECSFIRERILPEWQDETLEVDFISPVDRDFDAELRVMQTRPQAFTLDEWRKRAGEEELEDGKGDVFLWGPADVPVKDPSVDPFSKAQGPRPPDEQKAGGAGETPPDSAESSAEGEGGEPAQEDAKEADETARSIHGLLPVPGQDQLRGSEGSGIPKALAEQHHGESVGDLLDTSIVRAGRQSDQVEQELGLGLADIPHSSHSASVVPSTPEVNRAASYITLDRIAAAMEPRLRDLLLTTLDRARSRVSEGLLVQAIEDRNVARVVDLLGGAELARDMRRAEGLVAEVFKAAGIAAAESLGAQLGQEVAFDARGRRAVSWAPQRSEDLAAWVRQSIEDTGRLVVEHGQEMAWGAAATAGAVMLTYGLAAYLLDGRKAGPAFAVLAHQEALQAAGETAEAARAAAESYRAELAAQRAGMFGGDQSYSAAQAGQGEAWRQAKDKGLLPESVRRYWVTRDDRRVCPVCEGLHGQKRGLDEPFTSAADGENYTNAGPYDGPHDGCRCALLLVGLRGGNS